METKLKQAQYLFLKNPHKALLFCKKWHDLGTNKSSIVRGSECITNPRFYSQLGYDIDKTINTAIINLKSHLGL